jgi:TPR repeat protein
MAFLAKKGYLAIAALGLVAIAAAVYMGGRLLTPARDALSPGSLQEAPQGPKKRMANLEPQEELVAPPPAPSYTPDAPLLSQVRDAFKKGIGPEAALKMAADLPDGPERADAAFLLLEYAADAGIAEAAAQVARYYDPLAGEQSGTIRKNPASAIKWYRTAREGGVGEAESKLAELHRWLREKAAQGSHEAQVLLKNWEKES